jgi:AraC family transcriptional regulator
MKLHARDSVQTTLQRSNAQAEFSCEVNQHVGLAIWTNEHDRVSYQKLNHHTLSLYIEGGYSTRRLDLRRAGTGSPEKFCIFPAGHQSDWEVGDSQRFAHLYFSDALLRRIALETFDVDPRHVELTDSTFFHDAALLQHCQTLFNQSRSEPSDHLALQEKTVSIMADLLIRYGVRPLSTQQYRSGLSPVITNKITDYIYAHIDTKITLDELATLAGISAFHFVRMFKISTGETPHQKVMDIRIKVASDWLLQGRPQLETAIACGFVDQSHFSRTFKKHHGITPKQFTHSSR